MKKQNLSKSSNTIVLGADPGSGLNKYVFSTWGNPKWNARIFPSLYEKNPPERKSRRDNRPNPSDPDFHKFFTFSVRREDGTEEERFAVGDGVIDYNIRVASEMFSIYRPVDMVTNWLFSVLTMIAATRANSADSNYMHFIVNLTVPVHTDFMVQNLKDENIKGVYEVKMKGPGFEKAQHIVIDKVYFVNQALAALYNEVYEISENGDIEYKGKDLKHKKFIVIDIGANMLNYIVVKDASIQDLDKRRITEGGAAKVIKGIERLLENKGLNVSYATIQEKLMREDRCEFTVNKSGKNVKVDITSEADKVIENTFNSIIKPLIEGILYGEFQVMEYPITKILFTGGGVKLFAKHLKYFYNMTNKIIIPKEPLLANALGAWKIGYIYDVNNRSNFEI